MTVEGDAATGRTGTWWRLGTAAVLVVAALVGWRMLTADAGREAAAEDGVIVSDDAGVRRQVDRIPGGYHVCFYTGTGDADDFAVTDDLCEIGAYTYTVVEADAGEAATWAEYPEPVEGVELRWDPDAAPEPLLMVDTGERAWRVTSESQDDAASSVDFLLTLVEFRAAG